MILLVEKIRTDWEQKAIIAAAEKLGWEVRSVFIEDVPKALAGLDPSQVRSWGYIQFCDKVQHSLCRYYVDVRSQDTYDLTRHIPEKWLKRKVSRTTYKSLKEATYPLFIKPIPDKQFEAKVYNSFEEVNTMPVWAKPTGFVYTSEPVEFLIEIRAFIRNQRLQTDSPYMMNGKPIEIKKDSHTLAYPAYRKYPKEMVSFFGNIEDFLDEVDLPVSCVVDFGYIKDKGWAVIELNNSYTSGIYDCNPEKVLRCVEKQYG